MTNFEVLKQMPIDSFANMVFSVARNNCQNLVQFENLLKKEIPENLKGTATRALQEMQCPDKN